MPMIACVDFGEPEGYVFLLVQPRHGRQNPTSGMALSFGTLLDSMSRLE